MTKTEKALRRVAYHEAGHAAMQIELSGRTHRVVIGAIEDHKGLAFGLQLPEWCGRDATADSRTRSLAEKTAIACLAGVISERKGTGGASWRRSIEDLRSIRLLGDWLSCSEREGRAWERWLYLRTKNLLRRRWYRVEALAQALLKDKHLSASHVMWVVRVLAEAQRSRAEAEARAQKEPGLVRRPRYRARPRVAASPQAAGSGTTPSQTHSPQTEAEMEALLREIQKTPVMGPN